MMYDICKSGRSRHASYIPGLSGMTYICCNTWSSQRTITTVDLQVVRQLIHVTFKVKDHLKINKYKEKRKRTPEIWTQSFSSDQMIFLCEIEKIPGPGTSARQNNQQKWRDFITHRKLLGLRSFLIVLVSQVSSTSSDLFIISSSNFLFREVLSLLLNVTLVIFIVKLSLL